MKRRLAIVIFAPLILVAQTGESKKTTAVSRTVLYAALGSELSQYDLDTEHAALIRRGSVTLPASIQEAWPHPSRKYLYVAWSNNTASYSSGTSKGDRHAISAFRIDPASGALVPHGQPAQLPSRPVFICVDVDGTHVVAGHNDPSGLTVHRILPDGTLGAAVQPAGPLDFGVYGHQVRVDPSNRAVILVTRGNAPTPTKPEDPGALKIFNYKDGVLSNRVSIAPGKGFGYQVRHLDFHPSGKWAFVTLERQNQIHVYAREADGTLSSAPLWVKDTVKGRGKDRNGQAASTIHVHPNGRFVYVGNRAGGTVEFEGKRVFAGGENTIAVFAIDQRTGEPTLVQNADTHGFGPRTFSVDSTGKFLVVANQSPLAVRDGAAVKTVAAGLSLFRIRGDGQLEFAQKYDVETGAGKLLFWTGFVSLP